MPVDVVTGDRDLFQLIDDDAGVRILYIARGVAKHERVTNDVVRDKYGINATQYADFATLRGDASDGLPGVPGVGDKTAASLLRKFETIDDLLLAADDPDSDLAPGPRGKVKASADYLAVAPNGRRRRQGISTSDRSIRACRLRQPTPRPWSNWPTDGASTIRSHDWWTRSGPSPSRSSRFELFVGRAGRAGRAGRTLRWSSPVELFVGRALSNSSLVEPCRDLIEVGVGHDPVAQTLDRLLRRCPEVGCHHWRRPPGRSKSISCFIFLTKSPAARSIPFSTSSRSSRSAHR